MAHSPKKAGLFRPRGRDRDASYGGTGSYAESDDASMGRGLHSYALSEEKTDLEVIYTTTSTEAVSLGRAVGPLTEEEMEAVRQFGGDDYIPVNQSPETNEEIREKTDAMIREFETMAKDRHKELRTKPIVFANAVFAITVAGKCGCRLGFSDGSAYLDIPAGALEDYQIIYMYKLPEHTDVTGPADQRKIYSYSGLITCGPEGTTFNKDVTLNFEHCAAPDDNQSSTRLAVFGRADKTTAWVKEEQSSFGVKGNRVEHRFQHFSQRCYGLNETDVVNAPRLRMCLMLAVSRVCRHYVEAVLMRDEINLTNAHRDNFINAGSGFEPNEVHVIRGISIDPTQYVHFEGTGFTVNGPNDWNIRGHYGFITRTATTGRIELSLQQPGRAIAAISITEQGYIEIDRTVADLQVDIHLPIQVEDSDFGRLPIQSPHFVQSFTEKYNLKTFDGNAPSKERERIPHLSVQRTQNLDSGCPYLPGMPGDGPETSASTESGSHVRGPLPARLLHGCDPMDFGYTSSVNDVEEHASLNVSAEEGQQPPDDERDRDVSDTEDNPPRLFDVEQGGESPSNAQRCPKLAMPYEQASVEGGAQNPPEAVDETLPPNEQSVVSAAPTSSAEDCPQSSGVLDGPQAPDGELPDGDEDPQSPGDRPTTEECNDRVVRRRLISTSSCMSEDGEVLDREEGEMTHPVEATGGGDTELVRVPFQQDE